MWRESRTRNDSDVGAKVCYESEESRRRGVEEKVDGKKGLLGGKGEVGGGFGWVSGSQPKEEKLGWALGHWTGFQARPQLG